MTNPEHPDLAFCRQALKTGVVSTAEVVRATGLSRRWIEYIRDGRIKNPGIRSVDVLGRFLRRASAKRAA